MVKHTYLKNVKLKVSETIHPSGELHLNEEGIVEEELLLEVSGELTEHPDFVFVPEEGAGDGKEKIPKPEFEEGATKVVNGKGFIYKKNAKDVFMWLRHAELDEKDE